MRESIVCTGRVGKEPYRFPETGRRSSPMKKSVII